MKAKEPVTVAAVVKFAAALDLAAAKARAKDPYAQMYTCSEAAARKLCQRKTNELLLGLPADATDEEHAGARSKGAEAAIAELRFRAAQRERTYEEGKLAERDRTNRLANAHGWGRKRADRARNEMDPLRRLLTAYGQLSTIGAAKATTFDPKITGSKETDAPQWPGDPLAEARRIVLHAARELERELDAERRRAVAAVA